ncbi:MAG TPA: hypothetical protein VKA27_15465 [Sunxiuqinia sp.]|nr:hypothetical protein [Sunxiuqinia sp.]
MTKDELYNLLISGQNVPILANFFVDHPDQIEQIIDLALYDTRRGTWQAMWIADKIHERRPAFINCYFDRMVEATKILKDNSKLRHLLKIISLNDIPEKHLPYLLDYSIEQLTNAEHPVAIRVHAMQILYQISEQELGFKPELIEIIEHEMEYHATGGIKARGKRLMKRLRNSLQNGNN